MLPLPLPIMPNADKAKAPEYPVFRGFRTERAGFEPARGITPTHLAGGRTRPLCDLSSSTLKTLKAFFRELRQFFMENRRVVM